MSTQKLMEVKYSYMYDLDELEVETGIIECPLIRKSGFEYALLKEEQLPQEFKQLSNTKLGISTVYERDLMAIERILEVSEEEREKQYEMGISHGLEIGLTVDEGLVERIIPSDTISWTWDNNIGSGVAAIAKYYHNCHTHPKERGDYDPSFLSSGDIINSLFHEKQSSVINYNQEGELEYWNYKTFQLAEDEYVSLAPNTRIIQGKITGGTIFSPPQVKLVTINNYVFSIVEFPEQNNTNRRLNQLHNIPKKLEKFTIKMDYEILKKLLNIWDDEGYACDWEYKLHPFVIE